MDQKSKQENQDDINKKKFRTECVNDNNNKLET